MKKILNLLTAFMAVIGVCTAALVCFIIIYTNINGGFTPKNDSHTLTDSTEDNFTQSIDANAEQSFSNINNDQYPPTSDNISLGKNETIVYEHDISLPDNATSESLTGIENNFNTYNNVNQQNTTDTYVLNTDSKKIHYPNCNDVTKIASENYSTSNLSISELEAQGYTTCGHCFR